MRFSSNNKNNCLFCFVKLAGAPTQCSPPLHPPTQSSSSSSSSFPIQDWIQFFQLPIFKIGFKFFQLPILQDWIQFFQLPILQRLDLQGRGAGLWQQQLVQFGYLSNKLNMELAILHLHQSIFLPFLLSFFLSFFKWQGQQQNPLPSLPQISIPSGGAHFGCSKKIQIKLN